MCSFGATSTSHAGSPRSADSVCCRASSGMLFFLTQVRQHERSRAAFHQIRCKYGAVRIGQVPARSGNTHLERIRIRTGLQHVRVMVALQHDHFTAAQELGRIARHKAKVGRKAEPAAAVLEYSPCSPPRHAASGTAQRPHP